MTLSRLRGLSALVFLLLLTAASVLHGQGAQGAIVGRVTDKTGAVVKNATVVITNEATGVAMNLTTNDVGEYSYSSLNAGVYTVTVSAPTFESYKRQHITIDVDVRTTADIVLQVGKESSEVTVAAEVQQISYDSSNLGMTVEEKSITDLPLIYGNPFALEFLTPGVTLSGVSPNLHVYDSGTATVSVNGSSLNALDYKLDGAPDNRIRYSAYTPSTEFVSQYRVSTAAYDASQGHSSGGFVNVQLRSGTSQFHGSIFGYYQNPKINANVWALTPTNSKPVFVREGFGVGGPILRKKLFFFAGYEHSRQGNPSVQLLSVPTDAERQGDFSDLLALDTTAYAQTCGSTATTLTSSTSKPINKYQLFDPTMAVASSTNHYNRLCIPGNKVTNINSIAQKLLSYYPEPNLTGTTTHLSNYSYTGIEPDNYHAIIARFDYTASERNTLYGHLLTSSRINPHSSNWFPPVSGTHLDYENRGVDIGDNYLLSSTTVLNTVLAVTRFTNQNVPTAQGVVTPTSLGMPSYLTAGLPATANAMPRIDLTGYTSLTTATGTQAEDNIGLASVGIVRQQGAHTLSIGAEYRHYMTSGMSGSGEQGAYTISGNLMTANDTTSNSVGGVGFSVASLEDGGYYTSGSQTENSDFSVVSDFYAVYFHDNWRVNKKLVLNLGLRWEYETPDIERNAKQAVAFNFGATNNVTTSGAAAYTANVATLQKASALLPNSINPTGGFVFARVNGAPMNAYSSPKLDFLPRLGFSYAINQKTVIRGGYGIFFDSLNSWLISGGNAGSTATFLVPQQGYSSVNSVVAPSYTTAGGLIVASTLANPFPNGLTAPTGNSLGTSTALGSSAQFLDPNPHVPYNQRWSLGFQRQFGPYIVGVDYVGNHGVHQFATQISTGTNTGGFEFDPVPAQYYSTVDGEYDQAENTALNSTVTNPFYGLLPSNSSNSLGSKTVAIAQLLRPYPEFASINSYRTTGMSIYHGAQTQVTRRFGTGFSLTGSFTYSRLLDATTYLNPTDAKPWYGVSSNDRPMRFSGSAIYQLPWGRGRRWLANSHSIVAQVAGGWQMQGVYQVQSGAPLNFTRNDVYLGNGNPGNSAWSRSSYKNSIGLTGTAGLGYWFDTSKWLQSASNPMVTAKLAQGVVSCPTTTTALCPNSFPGTYQLRHFPLRYNTLRADHLNQLDIGLQRQMQAWRYGTLQFRVEAVNALNHPVYSAPTADPTSSTFGQITAQANQPRVFQFAGFYRF
jgi:hypothetical protein